MNKRFIVVFASGTLLFIGARAGVVINEFMAGSSDRRLSWSTNDVARIGSGLVWSQPEFADGTWTPGNLPALGCGTSF